MTCLLRSDPLPLLLLTGFLGSGKTSTLRHWLQHTKTPLQRVAVVINDFGSVNVDAALLARRQLELRSITGGCVCCQSFEDLVAQLSALAENPKIDLVWIETSGLADPEEVLDHLSGPELQQRTVVCQMILVLDGSDFPCSWRGRAVQEEQIRYADLILLNKSDLLEGGARRRLHEQISEIHPGATLLFTERGAVEPTLLEKPTPTSRSRAPQLSEHHDHSHAHSDEDVLPHSAATFFLSLPAPLPRPDFERFINELPQAVFRAKGFVRFTSAPEETYTFQKVRDQTELILLPLEGSTATTGLVLIGPHLDLDALRALAGTTLFATTTA